MKASGLFSAVTAKSWLKPAGICVLLAGMALAGRGALGGVDLPWLVAQANAADETTLSKAQVANGVQTLHLHANSTGYTPKVLFVQKNIPIRLIIQVDRLTDANNEILLPGLKLRKKLLPGENVWELPPPTADLPFNSWTGTLPGLIKVTGDLTALQPAEYQKALSEAPPGRTWQETAAKATMSDLYGADLSQFPPNALIRKAKIMAERQTISTRVTGTAAEPLVLVLEKNLPAAITLTAAQGQRPQDLWEIADLASRKVVTSFTLPPGGTTVPFLSPSGGKFGIFRDKKMMKLLIVCDNLDAIEPAELHRTLLGNY